jgi:hypothetical protein
MPSRRFSRCVQLPVMEYAASLLWRATAQIGAPGLFDGHHHLVLMEFAERVSEFQRFRSYRCLDPPGP